MHESNLPSPHDAQTPAPILPDQAQPPDRTRQVLFCRETEHHRTTEKDLNT
ncbi:hypothetical protein ES703_105489 [subsurface metagenome]